MGSQQSFASRQSQKTSLQRYILEQMQTETEIADIRQSALDTFKGELEEEKILDTLARLAHENGKWSWVDDEALARSLRFVEGELWDNVRQKVRSVTVIVCSFANALPDVEGRLPLMAVQRAH